MTENERKRIELDADNFANKIANSKEQSLLLFTGYLAGASAERNLTESELKQARNSVIDEALKLLTSYRGCFDIQENYTSLKYQIETLKQ